MTLTSAIVDDDQLCFGTKSLNPFQCNMCQNVHGQDGNQMIDIIILGENDLDYLSDENNDIPITIIETYLALPNRSFHNEK